MMNDANSEGKGRVRLFSKTRLPMEAGDFEVMVYRSEPDGVESIVIAKGLEDDWGDDLDVFVRVHSECFTGEVLGSLKCDCKFQLQNALDEIARLGRGLVIYLRQEGRGIGLGNKIRAYDLQDREGMDTVEANHALGFPNDMRDFWCAAEILLSLGIKKVRLNTNNPDKIQGLEKYGLKVSGLVPSLASMNKHNAGYMKTKFSKLGHTLSPLFSSETTQ